MGSLGWIARQVRPYHCYHDTTLQSAVGTAQVKHLEKTNQIVHEFISTSTLGLFYKAKAFDFDKAVLTTITDASLAGETRIIDDRVFPRRSQYGRITLLADTSILGQRHGDSTCTFHLTQECDDKETLSEYIPCRDPGNVVWRGIRRMHSSVAGRSERKTFVQRLGKHNCQSLHAPMVDSLPVPG